MSVLEDLYYGKIDPSERFIEKGSEYHNLSQQISEKRKLLFDAVGEAEQMLYDEIVDLMCRQESIIEKEFFIDGFRLGGQILLEIVMQPEKTA